MMNNILKSLYNNGWVNIGSVKIGKKRDDFNTFFFRYDKTLKDACCSGMENKFFALSLNKNDRIRLVNAPLELANTVRQAIHENWPKGIFQEKIKFEAYEFKLRGNPWWCDGADTVNSRQLVSAILANLRRNYWTLYSTCVLNMHLSSKSTFFFRHDSNINISNCTTTCISLNGSDKLRVMNTNEIIINGVSNAIKSCWPKGLIHQGLYGRSWQYKLKDHPFNGNYSDLISIAALTMCLIANLKEANLSLECSAFVSAKHQTFNDNSYTKGLSSLFFLSRT